MMMLAAVVACEEMYGPVEEPLAADAPAGVEITFPDVTDASFIVTVKPTGETSYYSYVVVQADAPSQLDSMQLYKVKYSGLAQGTVKYTAEKPSYTFTVDAEPNTTYQVYAVAGSPQGNVSGVAVKSVTTTDAENPQLADYSAHQDAVAMELYFSEEVTAAGDVTVRYFKRYTAENDIYNDKEAGSVTVAPADVEVDGDMALITVEGVPAGAYYTVSYGEGAFVDQVGNKVAALQSGFYTTESGSLAPYGVYGRAPFQSFDVTPIEAESFAEYADPFVTGFETENAVMKGAAVTDAAATAVYELGNKTVSLELEYGVDYAFYQGYCLVYLPEEPERGAMVTVTIPAGTFTDEWGNTSNEFTYAALYSYGYTLDDVVGTYEATSVSYWYGSSTSTMVIERVTDEEALEYGNVAITELMGIKTNKAPVYGTFDTDAGTLTVSDEQYCLSTVDYVYDENYDFVIGDDGQPVVQGLEIYFITNSNDGEPLVLKMNESGVLSEPSIWFGFYGYWEIDGKGYYDMYVDFYAEKVEVEATAAVAEAKAAFGRKPMTAGRTVLK